MESGLQQAVCSEPTKGEAKQHQEQGQRRQGQQQAQERELKLKQKPRVHVLQQDWRWEAQLPELGPEGASKTSGIVAVKEVASVQTSGVEEEHVPDHLEEEKTGRMAKEEALRWGWARWTKEAHCLKVASW